jgi:hypothetical protein
LFRSRRIPLDTPVRPSAPSFLTTEASDLQHRRLATEAKLHHGSAHRRSLASPLLP